MKKLHLAVILALIFALALAGCSPAVVQPDPEDPETAEPEGTGGEPVTPEPEPTEPEPGTTAGTGTPEPEQGNATPQEVPQYSTLLQQAVDLLLIITSRDYDALALQVHPVKGLRFSPEVDVKTHQDLVFTAAEVPGLLADPTERTWGYIWGAGLAMHYPYLTYHEFNFEYYDLNNPNLVGINQALGQGSLGNNITSVYPNAEFVEFYLEWPQPDYDGGVNWHSLTLVFETLNNRRYLVGLVTGFYTS